MELGWLIIQENNKNTKRKSASDDYILTFYNEIQALLNNYCVYKNIRKSIDASVSGDNADEVSKLISDENKKQLNLAINMISASIEKAYIQFKTLCKSLKDDSEYDTRIIDQLYITLEKTYIIPLETLKDYVTELNYFLGSQIMQNLLENINDATRRLYEQ